MYKFIDVNEVSEGLSLPSEALKINGEYIEDQIEGYRTLTVEGREALSPEVSSAETGIRDGATLKGKRYPARVIRITYQLIAASNEAFREAYNKLASILDVTNAELIFNDETDKYFTGTPCFIGEVPPGKNAVVGEFEILCLDPFKYSVTEYEAEPGANESSVLVNYGGTYKAYPTLVAEFHKEEEASEDGETVTQLTGGGACGYVAFFNENEKIIQLGDPEETDTETVYKKSQTLVNASFNKDTSWGSAAKSQWKVNSGITSSEAVVQTGNVGMGVASMKETSNPKDTSGTLLTTTVNGSPDIMYTVTAKTTNRTANSVKVVASITGALGASTSYFLRGYVLRASLYIGGAWHSVLLKTESEEWKGKTGHTKNLTITVSGLATGTSSLTGIKFKVERLDSLGTAGILPEKACSNLAISAYSVAVPDTYYLTSTNFGSGSDWHGGSITRILPADEAGDVGAANFTLGYSQKMSIGNGATSSNELGAFQCLVVSGSGSGRKILAGVNVYKGSAGKTANLRFYVNGKVKETIKIDLSYNNQYFKSSKTSTIIKTGGKVAFNICGVTKSYVDAAIAETAATEITFTITKFGTKPALSYNGLYRVQFTKHNCTTWRDIPNKFNPNDVVEADCNAGEIFLNGVSSPAYGAMGNDWEDFFLKPGLNMIGYSYSDWVGSDYAPKFKVRYREVFL